MTGKCDWMTGGKRGAQHLKPSFHIDVSAYGCENMCMGDINNDGELEMVFLQGPGSLGVERFRPGRAVGWRRGHVTEDDLALDCVTAIDMSGRILWQNGEPWQRSYPFRTHGSNHAMLVADLDGNGQHVFVRVHGNRIMVLDGHTGSELRSAQLDNDSYGQLLSVRFSEEDSTHILMKPLGIGPEGRPHGCPVTLLDHGLSPVWPPVDYPGVGHVPVVGNVEGESGNVLLMGWSLVESDGSVRWTLPFEGDAEKSHPDRRTIADVDRDGVVEQVLALETLGLVITDLGGHIKMQRDSGHCGEACVGRFFGERKGLQIMYNDEQAGQHSRMGASMMLDAYTGDIIWRHSRDLYGRAIAVPNSLGPQSILAWSHEYYDDPEDLRPFVMDGNRQVLFMFDIPARLPSYKDFDLPHSHLWRGDWGDYYSHHVIQEQGSCPKVLLWTRRDLWVFELPV